MTALPLSVLPSFSGIQVTSYLIQEELKWKTQYPKSRALLQRNQSDG